MLAVVYLETGASEVGVQRCSSPHFLMGWNGEQGGNFHEVIERLLPISVHINFSYVDFIVL